MKLSGLKILITGGAGFIGSHLADSLVGMGAKVSIFDNFTSGRLDNLELIKNKIKIIKGDIRNLPRLIKACRGIDIISHHAAQLEILKSAADPAYDLNINLIGTLNVLKAGKANKVKKIINASSACVYGQPRSKPQTEDHPTDPNWQYGVSKLAAEKYCRIESSSQMPVVSLRYSIVYGEREWYRRALTVFIKRVIADRDPVVFDRGEYYRDYIYVKDAVDCHNLCLIDPRADGQIFNVGTGIATSIRQLARTVLKVSGKRNLNIRYENVSEGKASRQVPGKIRNPADLRGMCLSYRKAYRLLGWQPKINFPQGIKKEFFWAEKNPKFWHEK